MTKRRRTWTSMLTVLAVVWAVVGRGDESAGVAELVEQPITDADRDHWSFRPLVRPPLPEIDAAAAGDWVRNPIDLFIVAELQRRGVPPQPPAENATLVRRLSFDLTGLPPTLESLAAFAADDSLAAYDRLVDRLLASPHFGERWAQHWLDLARFAETDGFEFDSVRPEAWRYRDWVIAAANDDLPYDRFVQLQLAGDELAPGDAAARVATTFCLCGPDMPDQNSQEERRHNLLNELTGTVGSALLGLQFGCAACHDHKYEPISQADFYRLRAIFEPAVKVQAKQSVSVLAEQGRSPPESFLMVRGQWNQRGPRVEPAVPRLSNPAGETFHPAATAAESSGRRLALAQWLTRPDHPQNARVIVNRVWQFHFGRGLTETPSDVGTIGDPPSHPELLDWLAVELVDNGWSLKQLHRLICMSATYRQASRGTGSAWQATIAADPSNRLWSRFPRRRLEGEAIRDAMLAAADVLNSRRGGPGVMPPLPDELTATLLKNQWTVTPDPAEHDRRSIYVFARRNLRFPIFEAFDRPDANASCSRRNQSTTAPQSLLLLNSTLSQSLARRMAESIAAAEPTLDGRIQAAVRRAWSREPTNGELSRFRQFLAEHSPAEPSQPTELAALADLCLALFNANEFLFVD